MKEELAKELARCTGLGYEQVFEMLTTPGVDMGDLAFPCFRLGGNPVKMADELAKKISLPKGISHVEIKNGYLNFFFDRPSFISKVLSELTEPGFGRGDSKRDKVMVEN